MKLLCASVASACLVIALCACTGTESGNPINPPGPPSVQDDTDDVSELADDPPVDLDDGTMFDDAVTDVGATDDSADGVGVGDDSAAVGSDDTEDPSGGVEPPDDSEPGIGDPDDTPIEGETDAPTTDGDREDDAVAPPADGAEDPNSMLDDAAEQPMPGGMTNESPGEVMPPAGDQGAPTAGSATDAAGASGDGACTSSACQAAAEQGLAELTASQAAPAPLDSSQCTQAEGSSACECIFGNERVLLDPSSEQDCAAPGRFGACLYQAAEFVGCTESEQACRDACEELGARREADAARVVDAQLLVSACTDTGSCSWVFEVESSCWLGPAVSPVECSLAQTLESAPAPEETDAGAAP